MLLTEPTGDAERADYRGQRITKFGDRTPLDPLDHELETDEFEIYGNARPHRLP